MNAIQPDRAIASDETIQSDLSHLEIQSLETEGLNIEVLGIEKADRWSIYHRLQELEIPCNCDIEKPLEARISTPTAALQLWCIARRYRSFRHQLLDFLEDCWQAQSYT